MGRERNHWWDWLKVVAALCMVCDHLRFVVHTPFPLVWIGRVSLPLFAVIASRNFVASSDRARYMRRLFYFGLASEVPFQLLTHETGNILFLLFVTFFVFHTGNFWPVVAVPVFAYGVPGFAGIYLLCLSASRTSAFVAGMLFNPWPFGLVSSAAALLPGMQVNCPSCPFVGRNWLLWFYPLHLAFLGAISACLTGFYW